MTPTIAWRRACASANNCVEVAQDDHGNVLVRDSKHPTAGHLTFTPDEWDAFTAGIKAGEFDLEEAPDA